MLRGEGMLVTTRAEVSARGADITGRVRGEALMVLGGLVRTLTGAIPLMLLAGNTKLRGEYTGTPVLLEDDAWAEVVLTLRGEGIVTDLGLADCVEAAPAVVCVGDCVGIAAVVLGLTTVVWMGVGNCTGMEAPVLTVGDEGVMVDLGLAGCGDAGAPNCEADALAVRGEAGTMAGEVVTGAPGDATEFTGEPKPLAGSDDAGDDPALEPHKGDNPLVSEPEDAELAGLAPKALAGVLYGMAVGALAGAADIPIPTGGEAGLFLMFNERLAGLEPLGLVVLNMVCFRMPIFFAVTH